MATWAHECSRSSVSPYRPQLAFLLFMGGGITPTISTFSSFFHASLDHTYTHKYTPIQTMALPAPCTRRLPHRHHVHG